MRVDIKGAVKHTGLSEYAIRHAIRAKKIPYFRVGGGKYIFDTDLLDQAIRAEMIHNAPNMQINIEEKEANK